MTFEDWNVAATDSSQHRDCGIGSWQFFKLTDDKSFELVEEKSDAIPELEKIVYHWNLYHFEKRTKKIQ